MWATQSVRHSSGIKKIDIKSSFCASDTDDFQTAFAHSISNSCFETPIWLSSEKAVTSNLLLINQFPPFSPS